MKHIISLFIIAPLLFSSSYDFKLPHNYYEAKDYLQKHARKAKTSIYLRSTHLNKDIKFILKRAIKKQTPIYIVTNQPEKRDTFRYYKLFKKVNYFKIEREFTKAVFIFDEKTICYSSHYFIDAKNLEEDYYLHCEESSALIKSELSQFKKDFLAN